MEECISREGCDGAGERERFIDLGGIRLYMLLGLSYDTCLCINLQMKSP